MLRYMTDRARPGLVALYNIRPGNGAGQFLQPRSLQGLEPISREPLMSVTRGQCDARLTVTFPAARHHRPLTGTKLYCLVTEAHVC